MIFSLMNTFSCFERSPDSIENELVLKNRYVFNIAIAEIILISTTQIQFDSISQIKLPYLGEPNYFASKN